MSATLIPKTARDKNIPLAMRYRPTTLNQIVGQPHVTTALQEFAANPHPKCWMLEGFPGTGKTATSLALANDMGLKPVAEMDWHSRGACFVENCSDLSVERAKKLFQETLRVRYGGNWNMLVLEELEWIHPQCQQYLKRALDPFGDLPRNLVVVATSNDASKLMPALQQRFETLKCGRSTELLEACRIRFARI